MEVVLSQVNARLDEGLKEAGTRGLQLAGYTPTQAIRALWRRAAELVDRPRELQAFLEPQKAAEEQAATAPAVRERPPLGEEWQRRLQLAEEGAHIFENALLEQGIDIYDPKLQLPQLSYEEMRDAALEEHWREKGYDL